MHGHRASPPHRQPKALFTCFAAVLAALAALLTALPAAIPSIRVLVDIARASGHHSPVNDYSYVDEDVRKRMLRFMGLYAVPAALGATLGAVALGLTRAGAGGRWRARTVAGVFVLLAVAYIPLSVVYQCNYRACDGWLDTQKWVAFFLGIGGSIALGGALLLAVAPSPAILAVKLPMAGAIGAHALVGRAAFIGIAAHGILYYFTWLGEGGLPKLWSEATDWPSHCIANLPGALSLAFALVLAVTSRAYVRRALYSVFYTGHIIGTLGFYVFGVMHTSAVYYYCAPASVLWAAELARRSLRLRSAANVTLLGDGLARVELKPPASSKLASLRAAGCGHAHANLSNDAANVCCCTLAARSHPYSVIECADGRLVAYVRAVGVWSEALVSVAGMSAEGAEVPLVFDGLHDTTSCNATGVNENHAARGEELLLVGGGTGVVPLLAYLYNSCARPREDFSPTQCVHLVVAARCVADVEMLEALPADVEAEVTVYHATGDANSAEVHQRAEAALARRGPGVASAANASASATALAVCTHAFALLGLMLGFRASFELPRMAEWARALAAAMLLNGGAVAFAVTAAHMCVWLHSLFQGRRGHSAGWWRSKSQYRALDGQVGLSSLGSESLADEEIGTMAEQDSAAPSPAPCILSVVAGRADIPAIVKAFSDSAAQRGAKGRVVSGGGDSLVAAVAAAAASCGVEASEAVVRLHTV